MWAVGGVHGILCSTNAERIYSFLGSERTAQCLVVVQAMVKKTWINKMFARIKIKDMENDDNVDLKVSDDKKYLIDN